MTSKGDTLKHISIEMSRKIFAFIEKGTVTSGQRVDGGFASIRLFPI